jgi:hypothetical protein
VGQTWTEEENGEAGDVSYFIYVADFNLLWSKLGLAIVCERTAMADAFLIYIRVYERNTNT